MHAAVAVACVYRNTTSGGVRTAGCVGATAVSSEDGSGVLLVARRCGRENAINAKAERSEAGGCGRAPFCLPSAAAEGENVALFH